MQSSGFEGLPAEVLALMMVYAGDMDQNYSLSVMTRKLQGAYAEYIYSMHFDRSHAYLNFTNISRTWQSAKPKDTNVARTLKALPFFAEATIERITTISMEKIEFSSETFTGACKNLLFLPNLKTLTLRDSNIYEDGMRVLSEHPSLEDLDLARCDYGEYGYSCLCPLEKFESLKLLTLEGPRQEGLNVAICLEYIGGSKSINCITFGALDCYVPSESHDRLYPALRKYTALHTLALGSCSERGMASLQFLPGLSSLYLDVLDIDCLLTAPLTNLSLLRPCSYQRHTNASKLLTSLDFLNFVPNLTILDLRGLNYKKDDLNALACLPLLETLIADTYDIYWTLNVVKIVPSLVNLTWCSRYGTCCIFRSWEGLAELPKNLKNLTLGPVYIEGNTGNFARKLGKILVNLESLYIFAAPLPDMKNCIYRPSLPSEPTVAILRNDVFNLNQHLQDTLGILNLALPML